MKRRKHEIINSLVLLNSNTSIYINIRLGDGNFSMAGVIAIAGFIHDKKRFVRETTPESKNSRVLLIHGEKDQVIYPSASEKAHKLLHESGYQSELQILQSSHKVSLSAKPLIEKFLTLH